MGQTITSLCSSASRALISAAFSLPALSDLNGFVQFLLSPSHLKMLVGRRASALIIDKVGLLHQFLSANMSSLRAGSSLEWLPRTETLEFADNIDHLLTACEANADHFTRLGTDYGKKMSDSFTSLRDNLPNLQDLVYQVQNKAADYDFENVKGNGLRSLIRIAEVVAARAKTVAVEISESRSSFLFRKETAYKKIHSYEQAVETTITLLEYSRQLMTWTAPGQLVPPLTKDYLVGTMLRTVGKPINQYCFYGRCLGIQFCDSIAMIFKTLLILMASFSEMYYSGGKLLDPVLKSGKYLYDPELRAKRIVNISQYGSVNFCKSFWLLGEIGGSEASFLCEETSLFKNCRTSPTEEWGRVESAVSGQSAASSERGGSSTLQPQGELEKLNLESTAGKPHLKMEIMARVHSMLNALPVCKVLSLDPVAVVVPKVGSESDTVTIEPSTVHKGPAPLDVRILSHSKRFGMTGHEQEDVSVKLPSDELIVHCHGGGFIAQSSRSHETYLRQWAVEIDAPILSIDYSLAPECPYPRALEECFYAYCWALQNLDKLGSTGRRVVLAGDSAGGNLVLGIAMKCIEHKVRLPDGIFVAYVPTILAFIATPGRLLCLLDPLLPFGFLLGCFKAYCCTREEFEKSLIHEDKLKIDGRASEEPAATPLTSPGTPPLASPGSDEVQQSGVDPVVISIGQKDPGIFKRVFSTLTGALAYDSKPSGSDRDKLAAEMKEETFKICPDNMLDFDIFVDPFLSPMLAPDDVLKSLPPISILTTEFDPFLDDCVELAKKLKGLGSVPTLDVLMGLSHGFLNFSQISKEASEGSSLCATRIKELLRADASHAEEP